MQSFAVLAALVLLSNSVKGGPRQALTPARRAHACVPGREPAVARLARLACSPRCRPYFGQAADMLAAGRSNPPLSDVVFHARCQRRLPFIGARLPASAGCGAMVSNGVIDHARAAFEQQRFGRARTSDLLGSVVAQVYGARASSFTPTTPTARNLLSIVRGLTAGT